MREKGTFLERLLTDELLDEPHCVLPVHARRNRVHDAELLHLVEQLNLHRELLLWGERRPLGRITLGEKDKGDRLAVINRESYWYRRTPKQYAFFSFPIAPHLD